MLRETSNILDSSLRTAVTALLFLVPGFIYLRGWYHRQTELPSTLGIWRLAAFVSGVLLTWGVLATPLAHLDHHSLTAHMLQHLVLMTLAAPLILLGDPLTTIAQGLPRRLTPHIAKLALRLAPFYGRGLTSTFPVLPWLAGTVCVIAWHVPAAFALAIRSARSHQFQQASFLAAGLLFWWPVVQPRPKIKGRSQWLIPLYLFLATLPCDALSAFLTFCDRVVYSTYVFAPRLFGGSALRDQESAGSIMWVWVTFVYLIPAVVITVHNLSARESPLDAEMSSTDRLQLVLGLPLNKGMRANDSRNKDDEVRSRWPLSFLQYLMGL